MDKNIKWLLFFALSSFLIIGALAGFNLYVNPYSTFKLKWHLPYLSDRNPNVAKLRRLAKKGDTQCLIVGSSRSEFFLPKDLERELGCRSFSASIPGARSFEKYAFSRYALENTPALKEIWYIVDFYEFNQVQIPSKLIHVDGIGQYFSAPIFKDLAKSSSNPYVSLFSLPMLRASLKNLKDYFNNARNDYYREDGTTTKAATMKLSDNFTIRVDNSLKQYRKGEWLNFKQLSPLSFSMLKEISSIAYKKNVKINFIVSPLFPKMLQYLRQDENLSKMLKEMSLKLKLLAESPNIHIWNFFELVDIIAANELYWYDGAHTTQAGSLKIIQYIKNKELESKL